LEWTGWYNQSVPQRLIGHYRLFQLFKKDKYLKYRSNSPYQSYILHYRGTQGVKYAVSKATALLFTFVARGPYAAIEIESLNSILVNEGAMVLHQFLIDAEGDLEQALVKATREIESPEFMCRTGKGFSPAYHSHVQINVNQPINNTLTEYHTHEEFHEHTEVNNIYQSAARGAQGKEKGVFSKKQILILFDLLAEAGKLEKIDYRKPVKFDKVALVLQALTGKGAASFKEELMNYKTKGLYDASTLGELNQVISVLINLAELCRNAGFASIAEQATKKIRELERKKSDYRD